MKPPATHLALRVELERGSSSAAAEAVLEWFARSDEHYRFYWENPEAQRLVTGLGAVAVFEASGAGQIGRAHV
jgi:isochorismate synthase EntC